eukprot:m51a1_g2462 putative histidine ammonia-lyase (533) ;mRNA; r:22027-23838
MTSITNVVIDGASLTIEQCVAVSRFGARVELGQAGRERLEASRAVVDAYVGDVERVPEAGRQAARMALEKIERDGRVAYGITTGFGQLAKVRIPTEDTIELQYNLIRSHASGTGRPLIREHVRAMMLIRANSLATGLSGVRPEVVEQLVAFLNAGISPVVPSQGSVGSSGDLAPTAHMSLALIGEGEVEYNGALMPSAEALAKCGIQPLKLRPKEGLSLINGTQVMTGIGALCVYDAEILVKNATISAAMSIEALYGSDKPLDPRIHLARAHPGQIRVADGMRRVVAGSAIIAGHAKCDRVQDAYSMRCAPQVLGPSADAIAYVRRVVEVEMNSACDNPLVFAETADVRSNGNFHGEPVGMAMDFLAIALAEIGSVCERRVARLVDPCLSSLPAFLTPHSGLHSGFMMAQYTAAALVSENKVLAHPAVVDSIPTSANQEDHVSMGTIAARKCHEVLINVGTVVAIEILAAAQGLEFHEHKPAAGTAAAHGVVRSKVPKLDKDRVLATDIEAVGRLVRAGTIVDAVEKAVGTL